MAIIAVTAIEFVSAAPEVTDITAKQRYPWNGLVDISCKVSGIEADWGGYEFAVVAVNKETGKEYTVSNYSVKHGGKDVTGFDVCENGDYYLLWNARKDLGQIVFERMTVRITLEGLALSAGKVQLWEGGPYWADRNVGADAPWKCGLYFWWGDTTGHRPNGTTFSFSFEPLNCPTYEKSTDQLRSEGWIASNGVLAPSHDAAHAKWGGNWRMPTYKELNSLNTKCDWTWKTINGMSGYVIRGKGDYAFNNIFLPCSGEGYSTTFDLARGLYWSSEPSSNGLSCDLCIHSNGHGTSDRAGRYGGRAVRPVQ